jgi:small-conductance mechanosensitive channel
MIFFRFWVIIYFVLGIGVIIESYLFIYKDKHIIQLNSLTNDQIQGKIETNTQTIKILRIIIWAMPLFFVVAPYILYFPKFKEIFYYWIMIIIFYIVVIETYLISKYRLSYLNRIILLRKENHIYEEGQG